MGEGRASGTDVGTACEIEAHMVHMVHKCASGSHSGPTLTSMEKLRSARGYEACSWSSEGVVLMTRELHAVLQKEDRISANSPAGKPG